MTMQPEIRALAVDMISHGESNLTIARALGVTPAQIAGVRNRDFGSRMTRDEALKMRSADAWERNHELIIAHLQMAKQPITTDQLASVTGLSVDCIQSHLRGLTSEGTAMRTIKGLGQTRRVTYALVQS